MTEQADPKALKHYIDRDAVSRLGERIKTAHSRFPLAKFVDRASSGLEPLEFTARTKHVATVLADSLPADRAAALTLIGASLPPPLPQAEGMFSENFWLWPVSDFVRDYGAEHWSECMDVCYRLTQCFTSEFAVRPWLAKAPEQTLARLLQWSSDPSEHVRRLCSEGPRPRLPWASRLTLPREPVLAILQQLNKDESKFVQKSVANHLNDLGKDDPEWLVEVMAGWQQSGSRQTEWIINHALRSHIKNGHQGALKLLGYGAAEIDQVELLIEPGELKIGQDLSATINLQSAAKTPQTLLLDWVMHYVRASKGHTRKVFKGKTFELPGGERFTLKKRFTMASRVTRKLHPGRHRLELQINGQIVAAGEFELRD